MSHFLKRITFAAAQPQAKLHPMIGSVFAPSGFYAAVDPNAAQHADVSSQRPESVVAASFANSTPSTHGLHTEAHGDQPVGLASHKEISTTLRSTRDSPAYLPLITNHPHSKVARLKPFTNVIDSTTPLTSEPHPTQQEADSSESHAGSRPGDPLPYRPLLVAPQLQALPQLLPQAASTNTSGAARNEASRRTVTPQHEPDEIHIHIGRIEVAAIASPAQQPPRPATPARRSLNLEEYLRRGNGRAR